MLSEALKNHYNFRFTKIPLKEAIDLKIEDKELKRHLLLNYKCLSPDDKKQEVNSFYQIVKKTSNSKCKPIIEFLKHTYKGHINENLK